MVRLTSYLLVVVVAAIPLFADPPRPVVDAVPDTFTPVALDQQHLAGLLASRLRANNEGYLEHIDTEALLKPHPAEEQNRTAGSAGLFLQAAANSYDYTDDVQLKRVMDGVARKLIAAQDPSGFLRTYTGPKEWSALDLPALSNEMLGLLSYSYVTGDEDAFAVARRLADFLVASFGASKNEKPAAAIALLRPMLDLYRHTGDQRYLLLSEALAKTKIAPSEDLENALFYAGGLAELYRLNGDESNLKLAVADWHDVHDKHLSITGAPLLSSHNAHQENGGSLCQTVAWMQLTLDLLRITGQPQYADELERTVYNQLLAVQDPATGRIYDGAPMQGSKKTVISASACDSAEPVGISQIPDAVWGRYGYGIAVLTYAPGRATLHLRRRATVQIYSEGNFPESGNISIHVEPSHDVRFPVRLRVPTWTKHFVAEIGGGRMVGTPGDFLVIDREWKKGDTIRLTIDMPVLKRTSPEWPGQIAIQRGPQILALARNVNPQLQDLGNAAWASELPESLTAGGPDTKMPFGAVEQGYAIPGEYQGKPQQLVLLPFADATAYRVWLNAPPSLLSALHQ
ncbi:MAG: glycoside hydrolase family 127 protein [Acidobacteriota bacterium]|nr:glycoside hydrolase family 127 protein [Acidobacteriota bacterium]